VDYHRLYAHRFQGVDQAARQAVWEPIARFVHDEMGRPARVLDPAAGRCEFVNAVPAAERWAVDRTAHEHARPGDGTRVLVADIMDADLPNAYFDGVFVSNFLEHLPDPAAVYGFLRKMRDTLEPGGRIAVMGPNIRYCARQYWDCADHVLALTHVAVQEHLAAADFEIVRAHPRVLPYSFRGGLPLSPRVTALYLRAKPAWRLLGKQFLVIARRPAEPAAIGPAPTA
jgi:SAM-dependent methyltransferase